MTAIAKHLPRSYTTRWSLIVRAQGSGSQTRAALGELLSHYEGFVVWLIRRHGHPPDLTPEELKQDFILGLLHRNDIAKLDRARGSFRGWLHLAVRRFLWNKRAKWRATNAGGLETAPSAFELQEPEAPADDASTREFAVHVVTRTLERQRAEAANKRRFEVLARFLPGPQLDLVEHGPLAPSLGMTPNALRKAICDARRRYRELLRESIRDLLEPSDGAPEDPEDPDAATERAIDAELRELRRHFWP